MVGGENGKGVSWFGCEVAYDVDVEGAVEGGGAADVEEVVAFLAELDVENSCFELLVVVVEVEGADAEAGGDGAFVG